jgi:hypothetical protein
LIIALLPARRARAEAPIAALPPIPASVPEDLAVKAASPDALVASDALYAIAAREDDALDFAAALATYEACAARLPSSRWAPRATIRANLLRTHAEGGFAPLVRLETVRRDPAKANDPASIDALARDADGFPPGLVRVEAEMLVAEAYSGRLDRPQDGLTELRRVLAEPNADVLTTRQAARELVDHMAGGGDLDGAVKTAAELGNKLDPKVKTDLVHKLRRRVAHRAAIADLVLFAALVAAAGVAALRRGRLPILRRSLVGFLPFAAAFAAYVAVGGGTLAASYETGNAYPFYTFGAAIVGVVAIARLWSASGSPAPGARAFRAGLCSATIVAVAFLLLERLDSTYLQGFGL